jgi:membrane protease YdiL (CAAX protease family)
MELLSPLEWLFGLLTLFGLAIILIGHKTLAQAVQTFRSLPPPHPSRVEGSRLGYLPSFTMLGLLLALLAAWTLSGLAIPLLLNETSWTAGRIESVNLIIQSLGFQIIGLGLIAGTLRASGISWRALVDLGPLGSTLGRALTAYLVLIPPLFLISTVNEAILTGWGYPLSFQDVAELFRRMEHPGLKALLVFSIVGVAPLFEETLFRGLLFPWLAGRLGWSGGMLISSAFFALIHFHLPSAVPLAALGIALCLLYVLTGRLMLCIFVHMLFNGVQLFALTLL